MYILSDHAVKAIHEHRTALAIQNREKARLRRNRRRVRPLFRLSLPAASPGPAVRVAACREGSE